LGLSSDECSVSFLDAGAINRAYTVQVKDEKNKYIMRVSLPLDPKNKTASEVATHKWLRNTSIPVPEIIAFDDSNKNPIGYEWILMQYMPGQCLYNRWRKIPWEDKIALVKKVADYQLELMKSTFKGIGSLRETEEGIVPGHCVAQEFVVGDCFDYDVPRGPFSCSRDWAKARADIAIHDHTASIKKAEDDEDDLEDLEAHLHAVERLAETAPLVFPEESECTVLRHMDLSLCNIMVDENNQLCGIIDWEFALAVPLWAAAEIPKFLEGNQCDEKPDPDNYGPPEPDAEDKDGLDDEGKSSNYWEQLMNYETTQLRKVYKDYMGERQCPSDLHENGAVKNDFILAIDDCSIGFNIRRTESWLDEIEKFIYI
jgi:aminoglycoside phosphotransferase